MNIVCLDLEGVLVPEIWIAFAEASGIPALRRTTRDEPDYDKLMRWRLEILKEHGLGLKEIQSVIDQIDPLPGAKAFLDALRERTQVLILSDTFEEFAKPLMRKLCCPPFSVIHWRSRRRTPLPASGCAVSNPNSPPSRPCSPSAMIPLPAGTAIMTLA